jgi:lactate permease
VFAQVIDPLGSLTLTCVVALIPVCLLLILLAVLRVTAWAAVLIGAIVTFILAIGVWKMPLGDGALAYLYGAATGAWSVDWIVLWGLALFNTLTLTGVFETFRRWLISQGTLDVRVQTMLFAWAFGALLEGLVGFGYPWAFVAPILITLGLSDLDAIRVAAIANNAPVSYGALGAPIIAIAAVTGYPLAAMSASVGAVVAILALLPPWVLIYLVSGREGLKDGWPLAIVGSFGYILGQYPVAVYLGPYLPDVSGSIVCFAALLLLLSVWRPKRVLGYGGVPLSADALARAPRAEAIARDDLIIAWAPFIVLIVIVTLWTGPWSPLPKFVLFSAKVSATAPETKATIAAVFNFAPGIGGSAIAASWVVVAALLLALRKLSLDQIGAIFVKTFHQVWGAFLVGIFIFGLAYVFNFSGMASSLAKGFSGLGAGFIVVSPILGFIGVALSGSNTSTNAMFGKFQALVGVQLGMPPLLLPSLNSVGAEIGKPIAPQTASVGVSTSRFVRNEGEVIRHNLGWTLILLAYLIIIGIGFYWLGRGAMTLPATP